MTTTASTTTSNARPRRLTPALRAVVVPLLLLAGLVLGVGTAGTASAATAAVRPTYDRPTLTCNVEDKTIKLETSMDRISPKGYEYQQAQTYLWSMEQGRWVDSTTQVQSFGPGQLDIGRWGDYNAHYFADPAGHYQARTVYTWWWRTSTTQPWSSTRSTSVTVDAAYFASVFPGGYQTDNCNTLGYQVVIPIG